MNTAMRRLSLVKFSLGFSRSLRFSVCFRDTYWQYITTVLRSDSWKTLEWHVEMCLTAVHCGIMVCLEELWKQTLNQSLVFPFRIRGLVCITLKLRSSWIPYVYSKALIFGERLLNTQNFSESLTKSLFWFSSCFFWNNRNTIIYIYIYIYSLYFL